MYVHVFRAERYMFDYKTDYLLGNAVSLLKRSR